MSSKKGTWIPPGQGFQRFHIQWRNVTFLRPSSFTNFQLFQQQLNILHNFVRFVLLIKLNCTVQKSVSGSASLLLGCLGSNQMDREWLHMELGGLGQQWFTPHLNTLPNSLILLLTLTSRGDPSPCDIWAISAVHNPRDALNCSLVLEPCKFTAVPGHGQLQSCCLIQVEAFEA